MHERNLFERSLGCGTDGFVTGGGLCTEKLECMFADYSTYFMGKTGKLNPFIVWHGAGDERFLHQVHHFV
jgi:hypothetical protein